MPAPLAHPAMAISAPPMRSFVAAILGWVSVVRMAVAKSARPSGASLLTACAIPARYFSRSYKRPMTPVEAGATSAASHPRASARQAAESSASFMPVLPVKQFAEPELTATARSRPARTRSWAMITGAALTRLVVKTPAAVAGASATMIPRSLRSGSLRSPAATPAKRKPRTRRTSIQTSSSRARFKPLRAAVPSRGRYFFSGDDFAKGPHFDAREDALFRIGIVARELFGGGLRFHLDDHQAAAAVGERSADYHAALRDQGLEVFEMGGAHAGPPLRAVRSVVADYNEQHSCILNMARDHL